MEISLALGGGGIKGIAHIGVLRCLEENGFKIRSIAGTSAGGIVGAMYAAGYKPDWIEDILDELNRTPKLFDHDKKDEPSFLGLHGITQTLLDNLGNRTFDDLKIPFACTAVDLNSTQEIIISEGSVVDAIMATIAVPGIFPPKIIGNKTLIDGGVLDPVPVRLARWLSPTLPIIAVSLNPPPEEWQMLPPPKLPEKTPIPPPLLEQFAKLRVGQALQIFTRSTEITTMTISDLRLKVDKPDVIIYPEVYQYGMLDNPDMNELVSAGEKATEAIIPELRKSLSFPNQLGRQLRKPITPGIFLTDQRETSNQ